RGASVEAIDDAATKVNRSITGAAMAVGAAAEIIDTPGYLPLLQDEELTCLFEQNAAAFIPNDKLRRNINMTGSTDTGDLSALIPCIHPSMGGFSGNAHSRDFSVADEDTAYIMPAKIMAMTVIDLLYDNAERAKRIKSEYKARMTKDEYIAYLDKYR
ncbi:MAG: amidohydrolase, partial [Eubacteriales bacterium]|nr:amidohydrolase [Eubacteriales bacterium]